MIHASAEFRRIAALPRRDPSALMTEPYTRAVTAALKLSCGAMLARPIQAAALVEIARKRGGFLPMGVGSGKTLVTFCAPTVLEATRAVILVPGGLVVKTQRDFADLRRHWRETPATVLSYEKIGRAGGVDILKQYRPDLIIGDECHALRNRDTAACARVVEEYWDAFRPMTIMMSGTITGGSLLDYAHLAKWCLGERETFLPVDWYELDLWRRAVDAEVEAGARVGPGVLLELEHEHDKGATKLQRARAAVRRRMIDTEGVIRTSESGVDASLRLSLYEQIDTCDDETWENLRRYVLPNGQELFDGLEVHRHARELACGYYSIWDPSPPRDWLEARKRWGKCVRKGIAQRWCNTEVEARTACVGWGTLRFTSRDEDGLTLIDRIDPVQARDAWLAIRDTFKPNPVPIWVSTKTLEAAAGWAKKVKSGIIWTQHVPFGERLEKDYGIPYFRQKGFDRRGVYIEQAGGVICASVSANGTGRNLQTIWSKNLIVSPFGSGEKNEQMLGRTHRPGQREDTVTAEVLVGCAEHASALIRAKLRAAAIEQLTDTPQKLRYADWLLDPSTFRKLEGARWHVPDNAPEEDDGEFTEDIAA